MWRLLLALPSFLLYLYLTICSCFLVCPQSKGWRATLIREVQSIEGNIRDWSGNTMHHLATDGSFDSKHWDPTIRDCKFVG